MQVSPNPSLLSSEAGFKKKEAFPNLSLLSSKAYIYVWKRSRFLQTLVCSRQIEAGFEINQASQTLMYYRQKHASPNPRLHPSETGLRKRQTFPNPNLLPSEASLQTPVRIHQKQDSIRDMPLKS